MNVGRAQNADPKWLLPMICRLGGVEKREIGAIRILDRETRFEIIAGSAADFFARVPQDGRDEVRITAAEAPPPAARREGHGARANFKPAAAKAPGGVAQSRRRRKP
jgi:ATP-dependent RNA helicase DeaD